MELFLLRAQIRPFWSRTMSLPKKIYWTVFCQLHTMLRMAWLFPGDLTSPVNMCHCIPKEVSRVRTRERNAHCFYRFWLIYLRLRVSPRGVRTQSRSVNSPRSYHWAMEAVGDTPKLRIFIVAIWPNFRKYFGAT